MRKRIFWTIFAVCVAWVLLGLGAGFVFFTSYYDKQIVSHLKQNSHYIEMGLKQQGISYLSHINAEYRISLIDSNGNVVYDNAASKEVFDNHAERMEFRDGMKYGVGQSYRYSQSMQQEMLYYAVRIVLSKTLLGTAQDNILESLTEDSHLQTYILRIASPHKNMLSLLYDIFPYIILILLACLAVSFMIAKGIANFIIDPLNALHLENPLALQSYKELLPLLYKIDEQNHLINAQIKQLQAEKETFNAITQNMEDGFLLLDSKGNILSFNKSSMRLFGVLHEGMNIAMLDKQYIAWFERAMEGSRHTHIIAHNDCTYQVIIESVFECMDSQEHIASDTKNPDGMNIESSFNHLSVSDKEQHNLTQDSNARYMLSVSELESCVREKQDSNTSAKTSSQCASKSQAKPIGVAIILLDITEKAQREQLRREFSANVSHELKTPLTSILAVLEMLQNNIIKQEDIPKFLNNMHKEARHLMALIEDIIILNELDNGYTFTPCSLSMRNLCKIGIAMFKDSITQKQIRYIIQGDDFTVMGEQRLLLAMLFHLYENAIKYNKQQGSVEITMNAEQKTLCISDSGIGIPEMYHERVFERFFCVDKSHSNMINGTGLGLSIVKHIAQLHNAQVRLKSTLHVGTMITLYFV